MNSSHDDFNIRIARKNMSHCKYDDVLEVVYGALSSNYFLQSGLGESHG